MLTLICVERVNTENPLVVDFCSAVIITHKVSFDSKGADKISDRHSALKAKELRLTLSWKRFVQTKVNRER